MTRFEMIIPVEPVPKGRPRFGGGHVYTPERTSEFENTCRWLMRAAVRKHGLPYPALTGRIGIEMMFWVREERSDWDNYGKALSDAGNGILWKDDRQIKHAVVDVLKITPGMAAHIELLAWELDSTEPAKAGSGKARPGGAVQAKAG